MIDCGGRERSGMSLAVESSRGHATARALACASTDDAAGGAIGAVARSDEHPTASAVISVRLSPTTKRRMVTNLRAEVNQRERKSCVYLEASEANSALKRGSSRRLRHCQLPSVEISVVRAGLAARYF